MTRRIFRIEAGLSSRKVIRLDRLKYIKLFKNYDSLYLFKYQFLKFFLEYSQVGKAFVFGTNIQRFKSFYSNKLHSVKTVFNLSDMTILCLHRLVVRTLPFHGENTGSNPVGDIQNAN